MKNFKPITMASVFVVSISTASAALIEPGMMNDFEDGTPMGWENGPRQVKTSNQPKVVQDQVGGNSYLQVTSLGGPPGDGTSPSVRTGRMTVSNSSYTLVDGEYDFDDQSGHGSKWSGDYSNIARITGKAMATSDTEDSLYLRLGIGDYRTDAKVYYSSKTVFELPTDGTWTDFSFELDADDFVDQGLFGEFNTDFTFEQLIKDAPHIRFISRKEENLFYGGERIAATLGLDDITAVSAVPLPGAVWMMISGLLSLSGLSSYKRGRTV